jgi:hypothetical protein
MVWKLLSYGCQPPLERFIAVDSLDVALLKPRLSLLIEQHIDPRPHRLEVVLDRQRILNFHPPMLEKVATVLVLCGRHGCCRGWRFQAQT